MIIERYSLTLLNVQTPHKALRKNNMATQKPIATYSVFPLEGQSALGRAVVTEDEVLFELGGHAKRYRRPNIESLVKEGDLALNKVKVALAYFDVLGDRSTDRFAMRENEFRALKVTLGK